ncbi:hypothetical protein [Pedobacter sp. SYP-B3415]|uniref:M56 family metallopeptidase n=1 Tax=Pedobacter sp. SYP-B3415 TaxID=2496641 RepID=UPI00101D975D|nr:hypothetical protein [Pedobacter sp. SYP-B3415]
MEILLYLLKVSLCLSLFFGLYFFLLRGTTFFLLNRVYLLTALLASFIIPAMRIVIERETPAVPVVQATPIPGHDILTTAEPLLIESAEQSAGAVWSEPTRLLLPAYSLMVLIFLLPLIRQIFLLLLQRSKPYRRMGRLRIINKRQGFTNCSFFNQVFVNPDQLTDEQELCVFLRHETVHVTQWHSADKVLARLAAAVLWFNPVVWWYNRELELVHEFEADSSTAQYGDEAAYASLLLRMAGRPLAPAPVHHFVRHPVRQRIEMLFTNQSNKMRKFMYLAALPATALLLWGFSVSYVDVPGQEAAQLKIQDSSWRSDPGYLRAKAKIDSLHGKPLSGKIGALWSGSFAEGFVLETGGEKLRVALSHKKLTQAGLMAGRGVNITLRGVLVDQNRVITFVPTEIKNAAGKTVYREKIVNHAFLYEANWARFAHSRISGLSKDAAGNITSLVLYDGHFTLRFNLSGQQLAAGNFRKGDSVLVKFFGESKTGNRSFASSKLIALYSEPKGKELRNPAHHDRFYEQDGKQKRPSGSTGLRYQGAVRTSQSSQPAAGADVGTAWARLFGRMRMNFATIEKKGNLVRVSDASIVFPKITIDARQVVINTLTDQLTATDFNMMKDGKVIEHPPGAQLILNTRTGAFSMKQSLQKQHPELQAEYAAQDSTIVNKSASRIDLFGKAELKTPFFKIEGSHIEYDYKAESVRAHNFAFTHLRKPEVRTTGSLLTVDFKTGTYSVQGKLF